MEAWLQSASWYAIAAFFFNPMDLWICASLASTWNKQLAFRVVLAWWWTHHLEQLWSDQILTCCFVVRQFPDGRCLAGSRRLRG